MYTVKRFKFLFLISLILLSIIPIIFSILNSPIEVDAPYYLSILERVADGLIPYQNLSFGYPPLWIYVLYLFKSVFSIGLNYTFYLAIHYFIVLISALLLGKIIFKLLKDVFLSVVGACLFIISSHWLEGNSVMLEVPSLMFGLLSLYLLLINDNKLYIYFLAGILASLAFFVKQYGLGFFPIVLFYVFVEKQYSIKKTIFPMFILFLGFAVPVILFITIWDADSLLYLINGGGYGHNKVSEVARGALSISNRVNAIMQNLYWFVRYVSPILVMTPVLFFMVKDKVRRGLSLIFLLGFFIFFIQFAISHSIHYYLYSLPFAVILSVLIVKATKEIKWVKILSISLLILSFFFSIYKTYKNKVYKGYYLRSYVADDQIKLSKSILGITKGKGTLFVMQGEFIPQYYLTDMFPPNISTIGYSFGPLALDEEKTIKQVSAADYVLTVNNVEYYSLEAAYYTPQIDKILDRYTKVEIDDRISIYIKKNR